MSAEHQRTIFLTNFHSFVTRNILDSGILDELAKDTRVVIFVQKYKEEFFKELYEKGTVVVEGVDLDFFVKGRRNMFFRVLAELLLDTRTKWHHRIIENETTGKAWRFHVYNALVKIFSHSRMVWRLYRALDLTLNSPLFLESYFKKYQPDCVFVSDAFSNYDIVFLKHAKLLGVPYLAMVRSWDNTTNTGLLRIIPPKLLLANDVMRKEMLRFHAMPDKDIELVGIPQFEYYRRYVPISREAYCAQMGLDPNKRIVLFSPAGDKYSRTDWQICEILKRLLAEGKIPTDVQFLVRTHPYNPATLDKFVPDKNFLIEIPNIGLAGKKIKDVEFSRDDADHLADTITHSAVILNTISSLMIDAAVYDKPVVTISFDGWESEVQYTKSLKRIQSEECYDVLYLTGAFPKVFSEEELVAALNRYLKDPTLDSANRKQFLEEYAWKFDGQANKRIVDAIVHTLG